MHAENPTADLEGGEMGAEQDDTEAVFERVGNVFGAADGRHGKQLFVRSPAPERHFDQRCAERFKMTQRKIVAGGLVQFRET